MESSGDVLDRKRFYLAEQDRLAAAFSSFPLQTIFAFLKLIYIGININFRANPDHEVQELCIKMHGWRGTIFYKDYKVYAKVQIPFFL